MGWEPSYWDMRKYDGIAGWLAFFSFVLITMPLRLLSNIIKNYIPLIKDNAWVVMKTPGSDLYNPIWLPLTAFELATHIAFLVFSIMLIIWFFQKKSKFPKMIISFFILNVAFNIISYVTTCLIPQVLSSYKTSLLISTVGITVVSSIWIFYFLHSKRVKCTFTR